MEDLLPHHKKLEKKIDATVTEYYDRQRKPPQALVALVVMVVLQALIDVYLLLVGMYDITASYVVVSVLLGLGLVGVALGIYVIHITKPGPIHTLVNSCLTVCMVSAIYATLILTRKI